MKILITLLLISLSLTTYSQKEFSLYFNNLDKIWNINREIEICQYNNSLFIDKGDIDIEVSIYENKTTIFFEGELVGNFLTKARIFEDHIVIFFIKSKSYYYIYTTN
jgi:hypothetical protein